MQRVENLLKEVLSFYRDTLPQSAGARPMLKKVVTRLEAAKLQSRPSEKIVPGLRHWEQSIAGYKLPNRPKLQAALIKAAPLFHWLRNPNYNNQLMGQGYMENYGFTELVGTSAAFYSAQDIRCGFFLLGPHRHYPPHKHPAEEAYHLISGEKTLWRRGNEDWRTYVPGIAIHHSPGVIHETKTADEPLLALYCWLGESTEARLVQSNPDSL